MKTWVDRINRVMLVVLGLLLAAVGIAVLLLSFGVFGGDRAALPVVDDKTTEVIGTSAWFWPAMAAVGVVVALLCLWWLIGQLRTQRLSTLELDHTGGGDTTLDARAITDAIRADAEDVSGVSRAHARMIRDRFHPELALTVWLHDTSDLDAVRRELDERVLAHAQRALGVDSLRTWLELAVDRAGELRVT